MSPFKHILVLGLLASPALAQTDINRAGQTWKPVDQTLADSPLSTSFRDIRADLRSPQNFDREYKLDGRPRFFGPASSDYYMRINGALAAIYPRQTITPVAKGVARIDIPPGTIFAIGDPPPQLLGIQPSTSPRAQRVPSNRVDRSAAAPPPVSANQPVPRERPPRATPANPTRPGDQPDQPPGQPKPPPDPAVERYTSQLPPDRPVPPSAVNVPPRSIWMDENYRKQRIGELLDQLQESFGAQAPMTAPASPSGNPSR